MGVNLKLDQLVSSGTFPSNMRDPNRGIDILPHLLKTKYRGESHSLLANVGRGELSKWKEMFLILSYLRIW